VRILVADDEPAILAAVRVVLEADGFEVSEAPDGLAALRLCRRQSVDLVLCDVFMPNQDGLETIAVLRQENPSVKIIAMSGAAPCGQVGCWRSRNSSGLRRFCISPSPGSSSWRSLGRCSNQRDAEPVVAFW
jgi:CheY-like chemotaxis protein